ncbi:MAG TPA: hypothetical protein VG939_10075, partial [Caulobacteraceae bacterium]|nr:hypothetical protein [Caulobacteraceae bacterium]
MSALAQALEPRAERSTSADAVAPIAAKVLEASKQIEGRFLETGDALGQAVETLRGLVGDCAQLVEALDSPDLTAASRDLERVARDVTGLGEVQDGRRELLARMTALAQTIDQRLSHAEEALRPATVLAINAKIEAARLGPAGVDFIDFSNELSRSLKEARVTLGQVGGEIAALGGQLQTVLQRGADLDRLKSDALRRVPARIADSVAAIAARGREAASAAAAVGERSDRIGQQIGVSVMALQIGDATRQRAEHVEFALTLARHIAAGEAVDGEAFAGLAQDARERLLADCCALQAIQLVDTADELDREAGQILASLRGLAGNAREVARIGADLYGADQGARTFLHDLEAGVAGARTLFDALDAARRSADEVTASASTAASQLVGRIDAFRDLESDVRQLALNAFLKCVRLGQQGRTLSIIAQELQGCADRTTAETGAVTSELRTMLNLASDLAVEAGGGGTAAMAEVMTEAADRLARSGTRVSETLRSLGRDSDRAASLVESTAAALRAHEAVSRAFCAAAAELAGLAAQAAPAARAPEALV